MDSSPPLTPVSVSSGSFKQNIPETGAQTGSCCYQSWRWGICSRSVCRVGSSWGQFPGCADPIFSPCPHVVIPLCRSVSSPPFIRIQVLWDQGPPQGPHFTFLTSLKTHLQTQLHSVLSPQHWQLLPLKEWHCSACKLWLPGLWNFSPILFLLESAQSPRGPMELPVMELKKWGNFFSSFLLCFSRHQLLNVWIYDKTHFQLWEAGGVQVVSLWFSLYIWLAGTQMQR